MAPLKSSETPDFGAASGMINHYGDVRARLRGRTARPQVPAKRVAPAAPVAPPLAASSPTPSVEPTPAIPLEIRDVVVNVADALAISPSALLSDLEPPASLGRKLAAALAVRRSQIAPTEVAQRLGVARALIDSALQTLDDVLAATQASAIHAPLVPLIRLAIEHWPRFEEPMCARLPIAEIQETVARVFRVSVNDIKSSRRSDDIIAPRHIAIYLAHRFTQRSMPDIGRAFCRDHSTAVYTVKKMKRYADLVAASMRPDASIEEWAQALRREMS